MVDEMTLKVDEERTADGRKQMAEGNALSKAGFLNLPSDFGEYMHKSKRGRNERLANIEVRPLSPRIRIVYILPMPTNTPDADADCVCFDEVIKHLRTYPEHSDDDLAKVFADFLEQWKEAAGAASPL